jgi:hypothetical protein
MNIEDENIGYSHLKFSCLIKNKQFDKFYLTRQ